MVATATNAGEQACPVCGAAGLRAVQGHEGYTLMHCAACGVQHWHPLVHPGAAFYEDERDGIYKELHEGKDRDDDPRFVRFFRRHGGLRDQRALDIGCSDGAFLARLQAQGNRVWGIDIDSRALEVARRRGLAQVERAEVPDFVEKARRQGLAFDLITAFDVIEHLTDPVAAVRDLASVLAPGGRFVGTVPNRKRLFANAMPIDFPPHHFYRFDAASMREALSRAGLETERVEAFQYNYTMSTLLAETMRAARRRRGGGAAAAASPKPAAHAPSKPSRATSIKHAIARAWHVLGTPVSYLAERPQQRGFKLWFEARKR